MHNKRLLVFLLDFFGDRLNVFKLLLLIIITHVIIIIIIIIIRL